SGAGYGAMCEVKPEAKRRKQPDFPPHIFLGPSRIWYQPSPQRSPARGGGRGRGKRRQQSGKGLVELAVGLAFGQRREQQRDCRGHSSEAVGIVKKAHGIRLDELAFEGAKMFRQAAAPMREDVVGGLKQRAAARRLTAAHEASVAAVLVRQELGDQRALAMPPRRQHKPGVTPFHLRMPLTPALSPQAGRGRALNRRNEAFEIITKA